MRLIKRTGALVAVLVGAAVLPSSCAKKASLSFILLDDCARQNKSFREAATYAEITVFKKGCPADADLALGLTTLGNTDLTAHPEMKPFLPAAFDGVAGKGETLPKVKDLDKKKYGFAAVMRDANCGVIAFGCTVANLKDIREVRVSVQAWSQPSQSQYCDPLKGAGCSTGRTCDQGRCIPPSGEGGVGDCDLSVYASGSLPSAPSGDAGSLQVSGPTVAASTAGFVVGYRTQESGTLYANAAALTPAGTMNPPSRQLLKACPAKNPADGVGLAYSGGNGLMALALPDCDGNGAGAFFMSVDPNGQISALKLAQSPGQFVDLTLAPTHALSGTDAPNVYDFVYRATPPSNNIQMQLAQLQGNNFAGGTTALFGAEAALFGMVASTSQVQALLGQVPSQNDVEFRVAGPGGAASNGADGGAHAFQLPLSQWGALTAWDDRAAAIVPGSASGLTLQAASATGEDLGQQQLKGDQFSSGDIVELRNHLIVVAAEAQPQQFTIYRLDGAQGGVTPVPDAGGPPPQDSGTESGPTPQPGAGSSGGALTMAAKTTIDFSTLKLPSGASFDAKQVSIAALGEEVAVVWRSKFNPEPNALGGWMLLRCKK